MDTIAKAKDFFQHNGRDIDKACFKYHFGPPSKDGALSLDEFLAVLGRYQNADGGFGQGLEVDIAAPDSNPFATELALSICIQANVPPEHELLQKVVAYLEQTQTEDGDWRFTEGVYDHDLAPWFKGWQWPNLNPACTTSGLLKELGLGSAILHDRAERLFQRLARVDDLAEGDFYGVRPYAFYFLPAWGHPRREFYLSGLLWWLIRQHVADKIADSGHFFEYVRSPETYIGRRLPKKLLAQRLDMLAAEQAEDGGWPSPYNERWRGWVTGQNLLVLRAFSRV